MTLIRLRTLTLNDGHQVTLLPNDYAFVQEWSWTFEPDTQLVSRVEHGRRIYLYHELIKKHMRDEVWITLDEGPIRQRFEGWAAYDALEAAWARVGRRFAGAKGKGIVLPRLDRVLANALTATLCRYYDWLALGRVWSVLIDGDADEETQQVSLVAEPMERPLPLAHAYDTLGHWMLSEYSGRWLTDDDDEDDEDTGGFRLAPARDTPVFAQPDEERDVEAVEFYADVVLVALYDTLAVQLVQMNPAASLTDILDVADTLGVDFDHVIERVHDLMQTYPVPEV